MKIKATIFYHGGYTPLESLKKSISTLLESLPNYHVEITILNNDEDKSRTKDLAKFIDTKDYYAHYFPEINTIGGLRLKALELLKVQDLSDTYLYFGDADSYYSPVDELNLQYDYVVTNLIDGQLPNLGSNVFMSPKVAFLHTYPDINLGEDLIYTVKVITALKGKNESFVLLDEYVYNDDPPTSVTRNTHDNRDYLSFITNLIGLGLMDSFEYIDIVLHAAFRGYVKYPYSVGLIENVDDLKTVCVEIQSKILVLEHILDSMVTKVPEWDKNKTREYGKLC